MEGINIITDDKGNNKAVILDLLHFKTQEIKAEEVLNGLKELQQWIDDVKTSNAKSNSWDAAKSKLNELKDI